MKILIQTEEFDLKRSREPIPLQCEYCHNTFTKLKHAIQAFIKRGSGGQFCSKTCSNIAHTHSIIKQCFLCRKQIRRTRKEIQDKNFCSKKCTSIYYGALRKKPKVIKIRKLRKKLPLITVQCNFCDKELQREQYRINRSKTKTSFCNKSCKTKYLHKFQIVHKPRSRAEKYLTELIKIHFPNLEIQENYRQLLSNNLEIDIYIPSLKLCIELNGPVHYFPIWGEEKLKSVQNKDIQKQIEIQKLGFNLMVIDISHLNSNQKTKKFLDEYFLKYIHPILNGAVGETCTHNVLSELV